MASVGYGGVFCESSTPCLPEALEPAPFTSYGVIMASSTKPFAMPMSALSDHMLLSLNDDVGVMFFLRFSLLSNATALLASSVICVAVTALTTPTRVPVSSNTLSSIENLVVASTVSTAIVVVELAPIPLPLLTRTPLDSTAPAA